MFGVNESFSLAHSAEAERLRMDKERRQFLHDHLHTRVQLIQVTTEWEWQDEPCRRENKNNDRFERHVEFDD